MKSQINDKSRCNYAIYHILKEYQEKGIQKLTKEIVKEISAYANVNSSKIWVILESRGFAGKDIGIILQELKLGRKREKIITTETLEKKVRESNLIIKEHPKKPSRELLERLYLQRNISTLQIAERYNRRRGTIYVWLREFNIPRKIVSVKRPRNLGRPSREDLYREYITEKKSLKEIAKIYSAGNSTIMTWLKQYEIPLRTASEELLKNKKLPSREELEELYINKQISMKKIAQTYHTGTRVIKRLLNNGDIPIRSYEDALSVVSLKGKKVPTRDQFSELYLEEGKSMCEIAKMYGLSRPPINRLFEKYDIKKRTRKQVARITARKMKKAELERFDIEKYNGLKGLVGLFSSAMDDEEVMATVRSITSGYLDKLRNLCDTIGEDNVLEELYLISKNGKNKFDPLLLQCLYSASLEIKIKPSEILNQYCGEFEALQKAFSNELKKVYIKYTLEKKNNSHTINN